jgi:hypothetical protein
MSSEQNSAGSRELTPREREALKESKIIFGAIGGLSLAFLIELTGGDGAICSSELASLDFSGVQQLLSSVANLKCNVPVVIALACCTFLIPISTTGLLVASLESMHNKRLSRGPLSQVMLLVLILIILIAISAAFYYLNIWLFRLYMIFLCSGIMYLLVSYIQIVPKGYVKNFFAREPSPPGGATPATSAGRADNTDVP